MMALGTIDLVYTVKLSDGTLVEMTSGQYDRYKFVNKWIVPILWVLFFPIRMIYQFWKKQKTRRHHG